MTDKPKGKDKPTKVSPIRKDVVIDEKEIKPVDSLVQITTILHGMALNGSLRDLAWAGVSMENEPLYGMAGEDNNYALLHTTLYHLLNTNYEVSVFPALTGESLFEEDEE